MAQDGSDCLTSALQLALSAYIKDVHQRKVVNHVRTALGLDIEGDGVTVGEPMSHSDTQLSGHLLIEQITSPRHGALESLVQGVADGTHKGVYLLLASVRYPHTTVESPHCIVLFATG
jgi:hypothetical protein